MNKKLTAKVQKVNPRLENESYNVSNSLVIAPDDEVTLEKKGTLYAVFDVSAKKLVDTLLVTKVVNDVLHDSYFQSESVSPLQAIEKAILKLRDNITNILDEETQETSAAFNIATAVLWGSTLYLVQYGNTNIFLLRDGIVKPIEAATEGKFSVASGVVRDNDVIILATENFAKRYPPDKLLGSNDLGADALDELESGMILKFIVVKELSEDEMIDFSGAPAAATAVSPKPVSTITLKPKIRFSKPTIKLPKVSFKYLAIGLLALLLLVGGVFAISRLAQTEQPLVVETTVPESPTNSENDENRGSPFAEEQIDPETDKQNKVVRLEPNVFYDIKVTDQNAIASDVAVTDSYVVVSDLQNGKIYTSALDIPKFTALEGTYAQIKNLIANLDSSVSFLDASGFKTLDLSANQLTENFTQPGLGATAIYLDFIYSVVEDKVNKYTQEDGVLTESLWMQNTAVQGAVGMGIDVSIYILQPDTLLRFTTGLQDDFEISGLDEPFENAQKIVMSPDLENIYIADAGNKRILVLTKDGVLVKQFKLTEESVWSDIKSVGVTSDETKGFVLNGTTVYELDLTKEPETEETQ